MEVFLLMQHNTEAYCPHTSWIPAKNSFVHITTFPEASKNATIATKPRPMAATKGNRPYGI